MDEVTRRSLRPGGPRRRQSASVSRDRPGWSSTLPIAGRSHAESNSNDITRMIGPLHQRAVTVI